MNWTNSKFLKIGDRVYDESMGAGTVINVRPHEFFAYTVEFDTSEDTEVFSQRNVDEDLTILEPKTASTEAFEFYKRMIDELKALETEDNKPNMEALLEAANASGELTSEEIQELQTLVHQSISPRQAGTWAVPYDADKAKELAGIIKKFEEKEISKTLYDVLGNDSLYDQIDTLQTQMALVLTEYVKKILKQYEKNPQDFQGQFELESLELLKEIVYGKQQDDKVQQEQVKKAPTPAPKRKKEYDLL